MCLEVVGLVMLAGGEVGVCIRETMTFCVWFKS